MIYLVEECVEVGQEPVPVVKGLPSDGGHGVTQGPRVLVSIP